MKNRFMRILMIAFLVFFCFGAAAENVTGELTEDVWTYTVSDGEATIVAYNGAEQSVTIPVSLGADGENSGYNVTIIASGALPGIHEVTVPAETVLQAIEAGALSDQTILHINQDGLSLIYHEATENTTDDFLTLQAWNGISEADTLPATCFSLTVDGIEDGAILSFMEESANVVYHTTTEEKEEFLTLNSWTANGENITIPGSFLGIPVREIGSRAFHGSFGTITLPESIVSINEGGFAGLYGTNPSIVFQGNNLTYIGRQAFAGSSIKSLTIPASVTELGDEICPSSQVETVTILASITELPANSFITCGKLTSVTLPSTLTAIGDRAFDCCYLLSDISLPEGLQTIRYAAFDNCQALEAITLPSTLTAIGNNAFAVCYGLTTVNFNGAEVSVGAYAFDRDTALVSIQNTQNITEIGDLGFANCRELTDFVIGGKVSAIGEKGFGGNWKLKNVSFSGPQKITIGDNAFEYCRELETIEIPNADLGDRLFLGCSSLTAFSLENGTIGSNVMYGAQNVTTVKTGQGVTSIGTEAFKNMKNLTSAEIKGSFTALPSDAFNGCSALADVELSSGITSIGANAFNGCQMLKYLELPAGLSVIGEGAFYEAGLEALVLPDTLTSIGADAFRYCSLHGILRADDDRASSMTVTEGEGGSYFNEEAALSLDGTVALPSLLTSVGQYAFSGNSYMNLATMPSSELILGKQSFDSNVEVYTAEPECEWIYTIQGSNCTIIGYLGHTADLVVPTDLNGLHVTAFGDRVFKDMAFLHSVVLPDDTESIGQQLFYNCRNLQTASLGQKLDVLPLQSFFSCTSLTHVTYPENTLEGIESYAFYNCVALTDANIPAGVLYLGDGVYGGCGNMTTAILPQSLMDMGIGVFVDCKSLTEISIPDGVFCIDAGIQQGDAGSFSGCAALTNVTIGTGLQTISSSTFAGLINLQTVTINADNIVSPASSQKHRKFNVQRPFRGIISAKEIKDLGEKPCTCRRPENVQTAHWTGFDAGITRNVRLIAA